MLPPCPAFRIPVSAGLLALALLCCRVHLTAQDAAAWNFDKVPLSGGPGWQRAAASAWWWELAANGRSLALRAVHRPTRVTAGVEGGMLVGASDGLYWLAAGSVQGVAIGGEPVTALLRLGSAVYVLTGSLGAGGSRGGLWLAEAAPTAGAKPTTPWILRSLVDLKEPGWAVCPVAGSAAAQGRLWVVTQTRLYRIDRQARRIETVIDQAFWNGLHPLSVVELEGVVHIGMRGGIASADPASHTLAWTERLEP